VIITKTPFRISFFGGGTDYPEYFEGNGGGAVLGSSIEHSGFLSVSRFYSRLFDHKLRVTYRQVECVNSIDEIQHSAFRECLRYCNVTEDVELNYTAHLPSFSGVGSSSSFLVGLLHALHAYQGRPISPMELAYEAIALERGVLGECVGCQDQTLAAVGGLNVVEFRTVQDIRVHPVPLSPERREWLQAHLMMFHTGVSRRASDVAARQVVRISENREILKRMRGMVDEAYKYLTDGFGLERFGSLLDETWRMKQSLAQGIADSRITEFYRMAREAGALGGKLAGAGGGGFLIFFVPPERQAAVQLALTDLECIPLRLGSFGTHVLHDSVEKGVAVTA